MIENPEGTNRRVKLWYEGRNAENLCPVRSHGDTASEILCKAEYVCTQESPPRRLHCSGSSSVHPRALYLRVVCTWDFFWLQPIHPSPPSSSSSLVLPVDAIVPPHQMRVCLTFWPFFFFYLPGELEEEMENPEMADLPEKQKHQLRHRELFLSRQLESLPATHIRYAAARRPAVTPPRDKCFSFHVSFSHSVQFW